MDFTVEHLTYIKCCMEADKYVVLSNLYMDGVEPKSISEKAFDYEFCRKLYDIWDHSPANDQFAIWLGGKALHKQKSQMHEKRY